MIRANKYIPQVKKIKKYSGIILFNICSCSLLSHLFSVQCVCTHAELVTWPGGLEC